MQNLTQIELDRIAKAQLANREGEERGETIAERLQRSIAAMEENPPIKIELE